MRGAVKFALFRHDKSVLEIENEWDRVPTNECRVFRMGRQRNSFQQSTLQRVDWNRAGVNFIHIEVGMSRPFVPRDPSPSDSDRKK